MSGVLVQVSGLHKIGRVAAGYVDSLAVTADGRVWARGDDTMRQLGTGTLSPVLTIPLHRCAWARCRMLSMSLDATGCEFAWIRVALEQIAVGSLLVGSVASCRSTHSGWCARHPLTALGVRCKGTRILRSHGLWPA